MRKWGVARLLPFADESGSDATGATSMISSLIAFLFRAAVEADQSSTQYVHRAKRRHHLRLRPAEVPPVAEALGFLASRVAGALPHGAGDGLVVEMGGFITNPKAKAQRWHGDLLHVGCKHCAEACSNRSCSEDPCESCLARVSAQRPGERSMPVYSCQLFLTEELGSDTGGLEVVPGTHEASELMFAESEGQVVRLAGPPGTIACYDGTLQHRGAAHRGTLGAGPRLVAYLSVAGPGVAVLPGTAMAPDLIGLRLRDLAAAAPEWASVATARRPEL